MAYKFIMFSEIWIMAAHNSCLLWPGVMMWKNNMQFQRRWLGGLQQVVSVWKLLRFLQRLFLLNRFEGGGGKSSHIEKREGSGGRLFCRCNVSDPLSAERWRGLITSFYCSWQTSRSGAFIARSNHKFYDFHVVHTRVNRRSMQCWLQAFGAWGIRDKPKKNFA